MDRMQAPLFEKLKTHYFLGAASFHVPGHKSGAGLDAEGDFFFQKVMSIDYTEITGLDDLHQPQGVIKEAEELAADCFGAEQTFFLVNGSTVGNLAMILALCERDDILIVQRNVHKSVIHAMMLAGAKAVFLSPRWDQNSRVAAGVRPEDVLLALKTYPEAKGILLTNPNYYGMGVQLEPIVEAAHAHNKPVLVDEAHGAHYGFHPDVPMSALASGADAVVQSTHKMLTAMTMGAMLHMQGPLIDRGRIRQRLGMLQSSSPSYPVMASLDLCRRQMHIKGEAILSRGLQVVYQFVEAMRKMSVIHTIQPNDDNTGRSAAYETKDPFKVMIQDTSDTLTGFQLQKELELRGCMVELADPRNVLLLFSLASTMEAAQRLIHAISEIDMQLQSKSSRTTAVEKTIDAIPQLLPISPPVSFAFNRNENTKRSVSVEAALHSYAAELVIPYPPGIPVLYPGEQITQDIIDYLIKIMASGARFQGVKDAGLKTIEIYDPNENN